MALFIEDTREVTKTQIPIPNNAKKVFKAMKKVYEPYLNKPIQGAKILKSLASDKEYNTKGIENKTTQSKKDTVSFDDARKRLERQNKLAPNSIQYQLYGGKLAHNILKRGVESARSVKKVDKVKPPMPTAKTATKPSETTTKEIQKPNGRIKLGENKKVNRALDVYHQRGDMASIFIQGGSKELSRIAENVEKTKGKKIYITETQLLKTWLTR